MLFIVDMKKKEVVKKVKHCQVSIDANQGITVITTDEETITLEDTNIKPALVTVYKGKKVRVKETNTWVLSQIAKELNTFRLADHILLVDGNNKKLLAGRLYVCEVV